MVDSDCEITQMNKPELYSQQLEATKDRINFLLENSNLPGPRGNLELLYAFMKSASDEQVTACLAFTPSIAATNTPGEFVAACGAAGLGNLILAGDSTKFKKLREMASDRRWRVREGVAFALQMIGKEDFDYLIGEIDDWVLGNHFEKRAVVAGLCEPALLKKQENAIKTLAIVRAIIQAASEVLTTKDESFVALKKGLGYGLSVAVVANPTFGKKVFEELIPLAERSVTVKWILKENLKKNRLIRMDKNWVEEKKAWL